MERLKNHREFVSVLRARHRVVSPDIVVHYVNGNGRRDRRCGLAVSTAVGNAVTRNRVKRRFRVLAREYESLLPESCDIVLRARATAANAGFADLDRQMRELFAKITSRSAARSTSREPS